MYAGTPAERPITAGVVAERRGRGMRKLELVDVPADQWKRFMFDSQQYVNKTPTERTLVIGVYCDNYKDCRNGLTQRVTDVRAKLRKASPLVFLCGSCRVGRKYTTSQGYVVVYDPAHPNARSNGSLYEHVRVLSDHIGRPLADHENVHHKNGQRNDNRIENLELWSVSQPSGQRLPDKIRWAIELKERYPSLWEEVLQQMKEESL